MVTRISNKLRAEAAMRRTPKTKSTRRTRHIEAALYRLGHTNVRVWWEPMGPALEMCGHSGGFMFTSSEQTSGQVPLGHSLDEALDNVRHYRVRNETRRPSPGPFGGPGAGGAA
jgi:hypothetical protein